MYLTDKKISLHPNFVETLFAFKSKVSQVFKDVLGLYEIDHIAITHIDHHQQLLAFSSTPSLEFNLFNSQIWRYDHTYRSSWYSLGTLTSWQSLYAEEHYNELYYIKQIQHALPLGLSFAVKQPNGHAIYSIASGKSSSQTQDLFANQHEGFYKIGQYCGNLLLPLINSTLSHGSTF